MVADPGGFRYRGAEVHGVEFVKLAYDTIDKMEHARGEEDWKLRAFTVEFEDADALAAPVGHIADHVVEWHCGNLDAG
jgi:hypothetical protein